MNNLAQKEPENKITLEQIQHVRDTNKAYVNDSDESIKQMILKTQHSVINNKDKKQSPFKVLSPDQQHVKELLGPKHENPEFEKNCKLIHDLASSNKYSVFNEAVAGAIIKGIPALYDAISFDVADLRPVFTKTVALDGEHRVVCNDKQRDIDEVSLTELLQFIQINGYPRANMKPLLRVTQLLAHDHESSKFQQFLANAEKNGIPDPTIYKQVIDWLGAHDEPYSYFVIKAIMSAVYQKQTYMDAPEHIPAPPIDVMLFGKQGIGKTDFFNGLSNDRVVYYKHASEFKDKDKMLAISGAVFCSADDTTEQRRADIEGHNSMITQKAAKVRSPYARHDQDVPLRCVWVGSTNHVQVYGDATGNRRQLPLEVGVYDPDTGEVMTDEMVKQHGLEWHKKLFGADGIKPTDPYFFINLWATFLKEWHECEKNGTSIPTVAVKAGADIEAKRVKYANDHKSVTELEETIQKVLSDQEDPKRFNYSKFNDAVKKLIKDATGKQPNSPQIKEALMLQGYSLDTNHSPRMYYKK